MLETLCCFLFGWDFTLYTFIIIILRISMNCTAYTWNKDHIGLLTGDTLKETTASSQMHVELFSGMRTCTLAIAIMFLSSYSSIPALETTTMCCMYIICPDKFACEDFRTRKYWLFLYTSIYHACFSFIVGVSYLMHFNYMIFWLWIIGGAWFSVLEHSIFWCSGFCFPFPSF